MDTVLKLDIKTTDYVNLVEQTYGKDNKNTVIQRLVIENRSDRDFINMKLTISCKDDDYEIFKPFVRMVDSLPAGASWDVTEVDKVALNTSYFLKLNDVTRRDITFTLSTAEEGDIHSESVPVELMPAFYFKRTSGREELLAAFVTPNHPMVMTVLNRAAKILGCSEWSNHDQSLVGYQRDVNRVKDTCAAIYQAIQELDIPYSNLKPAHSADGKGQQIRPIHEILRENGQQMNCLDSSCFYASCLEAVGLHPFIVILRGHAICGVHLVEATFNEAVVESNTQILQGLPTDLGNGKISNGRCIVVECTAMCGGHCTTFDQARNITLDMVRNAFCFAVDVVSARRINKIDSLDIVHEENTGFTVRFTKFDEDSNIDWIPPEDFGDDIDAEDTEDVTYTKIDQWARKLLSLTMSNPLINCRYGKTALPILCSSMTNMVENLTSQKKFSLVGMNGDISYTDFYSLSAFSGDDNRDLKDSRLRCPMAPDKVIAAGKDLVKKAKANLEERGASTLYLAVGVMKCYNKTRNKSHYAPILLYPCELSANDSSADIRLLEGEPQLNAVLLEHLAKELKIQIPFKDALPVKEDGQIDIPKIMATFRGAIMDKNGYDVMKTVMVGNFSFADIAMWKDIRLHPEVLENNKLVSSFISGVQAMEDMDVTAFKRGTPSDNVIHPVVTDSSQGFAIEASKDKSFVLQGPPGGGKSQTISGILASGMRDGKRILFCTDKLAALNVVERRMRDMDLGIFCLNLHNINTKKSTVLEQLGKIIELVENTHVEEDGSYAKAKSKLMDVKFSLDKYRNAIHEKRPCGLSLYEMVNAFEMIPEDKSSQIVFLDEELPPTYNLTAEKLDEIREKLSYAEALINDFSIPADTHALKKFISCEYSQQEKNKLLAYVAKYKNALDGVYNGAVEFAEAIGAKAPENYDEHVLQVEQARDLYDLAVVPSAFIKDADKDRLQEAYAVMKDLAEAEKIKKELLRTWKEEFLRADTEKLLVKLNRVDNARSFLGESFQRNLERTVAPMLKEGVQLRNDEIKSHLFMLEDYHYIRNRNRTKWPAVRDLIRTAYEEAPASYGQICEDIATALSLEGKYDSNLIHGFANNSSFRQLAKEVVDQWNDLKKAHEGVHQELYVSRIYLGGNFINNEKAACEDLTRQIDQLRDWTDFNRLCCELEDMGLGAVADYYRNPKKAKPGAINDAFMKALYRKMIGAHYDSDPTVRDFRPGTYNENVRKFRALDEETRDLTRREIRNTIITRIADVLKTASTEGNDLSRLKRVIKTNGRGMTLRKICRDHLDLIVTLCPVLMMSPEAVATFLPMENDLVDLAVFDEASQITTARAVGTLARATNSIIVGDSNQMPPTSFFQRQSYDENNLETEDMESVLDEAIAVNLPSTTLRWHYRSNHESLIAFSNARFYDNNLVTFPSARDRNRHVTFHYVPDGIFDGGNGKKRNNPVEAARVVEHLKNHAKDPATKDLSVGIISFNVEQQKTIEDLIEKAAKEDEDLRTWLAAISEKEPLFVKNLENAQGEERDVIILSVNYGSDGRKFSMNLGPMNKDSGFRRLNVAITRGRNHLHVFSSIYPSQLDPERSNSRGISELRKFLEYADNGPIPESNSWTVTRSVEPSGIALAIADRLKADGYDCVTNVGHSALRVDLAVVDPKAPDRYLMGILLDGDSYAAGKTTRDRELGHPGVLNNLGWNILRVHSMEWYNNRDKVMESILKKLAEEQEPQTEA